MLVDSNAEACTAAEEAGFNVVFGSGLSERVLRQVDPSSRRGVLGVTPSEATNLLFVRDVRRHHQVTATWAALGEGAKLRPHQMHEVGARLLFGGVRDLDLWSLHLERGEAAPEAWLVGDQVEPPTNVLPLLRDSGQLAPFDDETRLEAGDTLWLVVEVAKRSEVEATLTELGWSKVVG